MIKEGDRFKWTINGEDYLMQVTSVGFCPFDCEFQLSAECLSAGTFEGNKQRFSEKKLKDLFLTGKAAFVISLED